MDSVLDAPLSGSDLAEQHAGEVSDPDTPPEEPARPRGRGRGQCQQRPARGRGRGRGRGSCGFWQIV